MVKLSFIQEVAHFLLASTGLFAFPFYRIISCGIANDIICV